MSGYGQYSYPFFSNTCLSASKGSLDLFAARSNSCRLGRDRGCALLCSIVEEKHGKKEVTFRKGTVQPTLDLKWSYMKLKFKLGCHRYEMRLTTSCMFVSLGTSTWLECKISKNFLISYSSKVVPHQIIHNTLGHPFGLQMTGVQFLVTPFDPARYRAHAVYQTKSTNLSQNLYKYY